MPFEYDLENEQELEALTEAAGYLICWNFGLSLLTVMRKSVFEDALTWQEYGLPKEKFWRAKLHCGRENFYLRILSAELTYVFPVWLANALRNR